MFPPPADLIPHRPPFLFVDAIVSENDDTLVARRLWRADEPFYQGHYPGAPITPGVLLCEALFQTGALYMTRKMPQIAGALPILARIENVRFRAPVFPGETTFIEARKKETVGAFVLMSGSIRNAKNERVLSADFAVTIRPKS
ncbi:MAG: beta-hydroxyacyl-ACP dehydratase [Opitutaceae bacterium]|jgi:3-hydroxyacyl-[acyl-carrier-protein] dehydratase|nr:beta-hydroxyacyl-ACP dehydratase [Opitutaceae bacterium]